MQVTGAGGTCREPKKECWFRDVSINPLKHFFKVYGQFEVKAMIIQRLVFVFSEGGSMKLGTQQENGIKMKVHVLTHMKLYAYIPVCLMGKRAVEMSEHSCIGQWRKGNNERK